MTPSPHLLTISPVVLESSAWSRDPTLPALGSSCPAQELWDQPAGGWPALPLSSQQELRLSGNKRERGSHACSLCFPPESVLPAIRGRCLRSAGASSACPNWHLSPLSRGIEDAGTPQAPGCQTGQSEGEEGRGLHAPLGSKTQCWRPGSDFPRNSLDQVRTTIIQTLNPQMVLPPMVLKWPT